MVPYTDDNITIRVRGVNLTSANEVRVTFRQGKTKLTFQYPKLDFDGEYITVHMTQEDTSKFTPTDDYNAEKCLAIVNWFDDTMRKGSTVVEIKVQKQLLQQVIPYGTDI